MYPMLQIKLQKASPLQIKAQYQPDEGRMVIVEVGQTSTGDAHRMPFMFADAFLAATSDYRRAPMRESIKQEGLDIFGIDGTTDNEAARQLLVANKSKFDEVQKAYIRWLFGLSLSRVHIIGPSEGGLRQGSQVEFSIGGKVFYTDIVRSLAYFA